MLKHKLSEIFCTEMFSLYLWHRQTIAILTWDRSNNFNKSHTSLLWTTV